jgi:hypothetical protein
MPARAAFLLLLALALIAAAPSPAPVDWSHAAVQDLTAIHDILQANHPGPVDPANPAFTTWLNTGEAALLPRAQTANTEHDYQSVLRDYVNGFADGHVNIAMTDPETHLWPGFLVRADRLGAPVRVALLAAPGQAPPGLALGDELLSCNGVPVGRMLTDRVLRPLLNRNIPQRLFLKSAMLMVVDADDPAARSPSCTFRRGSTTRTLPLAWRPIAVPALAQAVQSASGIEIPPCGAKKQGDVWLISLPTFDPNDDQLPRLQTLIAFLQHNAALLHQARHVVIDLRGNDGGDDGWGDDVASALWNAAAVTDIESSASETIDWRVSARNIAALRLRATAAQAQGQNDAVTYYLDLAHQMTRAAARHQVFLVEPDPATAHLPAFASPFRHPVYILTTPYCASACLDFVDVTNHLPGAIRIGLQTSSDTDYLDTAAPLPSGHAVLNYAMKVFRNRPRPANASYEPQIPWPGGPMTTTTIARWVETLP